MSLYKCRKCRNSLFSDDCVITDHGLKDSVCPAASNVLPTQWFLSCESDNTPQWIYQALTEGCWNKGKLYCPKCQGRIGSFDFISGNKCPCGQFTLPPLHVHCCRVDQMPVTLQQEQYQRIKAVSKQRTAEQDPSRSDILIPAQYDVSTEVVPTACTNQTRPQTTVTVNAVGNLQESERKNKRVRKRRMLIHEVPYDPPTVINENQFEILKQDNDVDDTYLKQKAIEDLVKPSWEAPIESTVSEDHCCPVCLDIFCIPTTCQPCSHSFCNPCLRRLARGKPQFTPCPLCRKVIVSCIQDNELEAKLKDLYPEEYKKRLQKERKACLDSFYPLPSCANPSLQRVRPDFSGITRTQVVLMAVLLTVCVCITPMKSLVHNMLKMLSFCIDNLLYFLDSALTVMALHDILQLF